MADGSIALNDWISRLHKLPALARTAAPKVAEAIDAEIRAQIARGEGPDGKPWPKTQDGKQPLQNAGRVLQVRPVGDVVVARISGVEARHHLGAVKGGVKREILPTGKIPDPVTRAIKKIVTQEFQATMGARNR